MGERRLRMLEARLPPDVFVLGVDEHTGAVFDLDAGTVTVTGNGGLSVRVAGRTRRFETGTVVPIGALREGGHDSAESPPPHVEEATDPLADEVGQSEQAFTEALA